MRISMSGRLVLSGLLASGCTGVSGTVKDDRGGITASPGASPDTGSTTGPVLPGIEVLQVTLATDSAGTGCTASVVPGMGVTLTESKNEILVVAIESACKVKDKLHIKYDATNPVNKSRPDCLGQPKGTVLNGDFPVNAGQTVYLVCTVAYDSANAADDSFTVGWPSTAAPPKERKSPAASEIALEDDPLL